MKTRAGYVSNSSSSSYVIISYNDTESPQLPSHLVIGEQGECEFGWTHRIYGGFWTKLNFAWMQAGYRQEWMDMLFGVLAGWGVERVTSILSKNFEAGTRYAYIDHQSSAAENENTEIFDDEGKLRAFLTSPHSIIQGGNDN